MTEEEKFVRNKIEECTRIIENSSYIGNKKAYARERTQLKCVLNLIQKQQKTLEKKDKIIDELEDIFFNYQLCEYELTDCTYRKCEYIRDDETPPCKECIKEYFTKKVEDK